MPSNIEIEIRSFLNAEKFDELVKWFDQETAPAVPERQETWYFEADKDLRIQRTDNGAKIWMKGGQMHDEARQEIEVPIGRENFADAADIFSSLGYPVKVKWFRERRRYLWDGIKVCLDHTLGYGDIIELELLGTVDSQASDLARLTERMERLGVRLTPKEEFDRKFEDYLQNWETLTKS